ncbi:MAG: hypothetical protein UZ13_03730 [Chloroflexi bacterium OLB13]|nr:MAG: hypothetical protein UZ13_03730 [Chloroflexi bacterium OLB13]
MKLLPWVQRRVPQSVRPSVLQPPSVLRSVRPWVLQSAEQPQSTPPPPRHAVSRAPDGPRWSTGQSPGLPSARRWARRSELPPVLQSGLPSAPRWVPRSGLPSVPRWVPRSELPWVLRWAGQRSARPSAFQPRWSLPHRRSPARPPRPAQLRPSPRLRLPAAPLAPLRPQLPARWRSPEWPTVSRCQPPRCRSHMPLRQVTAAAAALRSSQIASYFLLEMRKCLRVSAQSKS